MNRPYDIGKYQRRLYGFLRAGEENMKITDVKVQSFRQPVPAGNKDVRPS